MDEVKNITDVINGLSDENLKYYRYGYEASKRVYTYGDSLDVIRDKEENVLNLVTNLEKLSPLMEKLFSKGDTND